MYLNIIGIIITLIASIFIRRNLVKYANKLDEKLLSNSDYTVYAIDLPLNMDDKRLKDKIESNFGVKVIYINFCYHIDEYMHYVLRLKELYRLKGIY